jgi:hypothetical protein
MRNGAIPHGSSRSPAPSGSWPATTCWNCGIRNITPVSEALMAKIAALPAENAEERNSRIGSIGRAARRSQAANGDQHGGIRGQRAPRRRHREHREPGCEDPAAAQPAAERRRGHQQHREAERVGVDRPLQIRQRHAQVVPERGQRDDHNHRVKDHDERRQRRQPQHPPLFPRCAGWPTACCYLPANHVASPCRRFASAALGPGAGKKLADGGPTSFRGRQGQYMRMIIRQEAPWEKPLM